MNRFLLISVLLSLPLAVSAQAPNLADRHVAKSMPCASCHGTDKPEPFSEVQNETCLQCHGPLTALKARYKDMGKKNPHDNHLGDPSCSVCHKGHEPSTVYCDNCHKDFGLKLK